MIDLLHAGQGPPRDRVPIRLNVAFRSDLAWWQAFIAEWNGVSFLTPPQLLPEWEMASDALGTWGCGSWYCNLWFQIPWDASTHGLPITVKELLPIIVAGALWAGHRIRCHCDNQAVVACLRSRTSRHKGLMHLLRTLVFVKAHFGFQFYPVYVDTHANHLADNLSRNNCSSFLSKVPHARRKPSLVPPPLLHLLLDPRADWVSPLWRRRFSGIFSRVLPNPPRGHMVQH